MIKICYYYTSKGGVTMLNQIVLVGRIVQEPELKKTDSGKNVANLTIAVQRPFKNINSEYDTDFIPCILWTGIAENTVEYCKKGDLVGIRGRLQTRIVEINEEEKRQYVEVVVEKVTFIAGNKRDD